MEFSYEFIPQGSVVVPAADGWRYLGLDGQSHVFDPTRTVICDVGNQLIPGLIDQHAPETGGLCTTSLLVARPDFLLGNIDPRAERIALVTHLEPDFDAAASLFLVRNYLRFGRLPSFAPALARYAQFVDAGRLQLDPTVPVNPAALVQAIGLGGGRENIPTRTDRRVLHEIFRFFSAWPDLLRHEPNPMHPAFLKPLRGFDTIIDHIHQDRQTYLEDIRERSEFLVLRLPNRNTGEEEPVDCIVTYRPRSILWKYWTRRDRQHSRFGRGFPVTCAFFDTFYPRTRAIIATDPNLPYDLKGLGLLLEELETEALENIGLGEAPDAQPRPGFQRANPWYDGRNPLHEFTIVDAPRGGSVLTPTAIKSSLQRDDLWVRRRHAFDRQHRLVKDPGSLSTGSRVT